MITNGALVRSDLFSTGYVLNTGRYFARVWFSGCIVNMSIHDLRVVEQVGIRL